MRCTLIGAGRLGKNIALALNSAHIISSLVICNRSLASAQQACEDIGLGLAIAHINELPTTDVIWLCCNDDMIPQVVSKLICAPKLKPETFVIHCSGVLNSSLLAPLKHLGCSVASLHPLKAFKMGYLDATAFHQVDCVLEGDAAVCEWLKTSFIQLGAYVSSISPENKAKYHAAASIASNYLITLASCSEELFLNAGLPAEQVRRMLVNLMRGNLNNLQQVSSISEALTGPLARGDINTLALHLNAIENPKSRHLYQAAGLATLSLTALTTEQKDAIGSLLAE